MSASSSVSALIEEAERLLKEITPGDWTLVEQVNGWHWPPDPRCRIESWRDYGPNRRGSSDIAQYLYRPNAEFIAAAPRLVRGLLDLLVSQQQERDQRSVAHGQSELGDRSQNASPDLGVVTGQVQS
jgi:hypothetical protein